MLPALDSAPSLHPFAYSYWGRDSFEDQKRLCSASTDQGPTAPNLTTRKVSVASPRDSDPLSGTLHYSGSQVVGLQACYSKPNYKALTITESQCWDSWSSLFSAEGLLPVVWTSCSCSPFSNLVAVQGPDETDPASLFLGWKWLWIGTSLDFCLYCCNLYFVGFSSHSAPPHSNHSLSVLTLFMLHKYPNWPAVCAMNS